MTHIDLSIIIVNYQTPKITLNCLASIYASKDALNKEVIIIDNASADDSIKQISSTYPQLKIIKNKSNLGFSVANNLGVAQAQGDYVLLLNSDTLVSKNTLQRFYDLTKLHQAKIASCRLLNPDNSLQPQGGALPNLYNLTTWMLNLDSLGFINKLIPPYQHKHPDYFNHTHPVGWLGGTALMIHKDFYNRLGGLDKHIFMYAEDLDFCVRASLVGEPIWYFHEPQIIHFGQGSGTLNNSILGEYKGLMYLYSQHKPMYQSIILKVLLKTGAFLRYLIFAMMGNNDQKKLYLQALGI